MTAPTGKLLALSAPLLLASCGGLPHQVECVNIASHERLTNASMQSPSEPGSFTGTDWQGFRRYVANDDRKWWKCRYSAALRNADSNQ